MRVLIFIILCCVFSNVFGQNKSYKLYEDSILPIIEVDYIKSKSFYQKYSKIYNFDPLYTLSFLESSLKNNDIIFFKKEIYKLIKFYGYSFSMMDTTRNSMDSPFNQLVYEKEIHEWLAVKSKKKHPIWVKKHPNAEHQRDLLNALHTKDQLIRQISFDFFPVMKELDSVCYNNFRNLYDSLLTSIDADNIILIQNACIKNNFNLINNFDNGYRSSKIVGLIISHNLKRGKYLNETWERLYPYVEKAYIEGKISDILFYEYDFNLNKHYGYQYYGTLDESVPLRDPETFEARKKRLKL